MVLNGSLDIRISIHLFRKIKISKTTREIIIHKLLCNVIAVPNPSQYTKSKKYKIKIQEVEIGPKFVRNADFVYCLLFLPSACTHVSVSCQPRVTRDLSASHSSSTAMTITFREQLVFTQKRDNSKGNIIGI